jgi:hypothetical protein
LILRIYPYFLAWNTSNTPEFLFHSTLICATHFPLFGFTSHFILNTQNPKTTFNPHVIFEHQSRPITTTDQLQVTLFVGDFWNCKYFFFLRFSLSLTNDLLLSYCWFLFVVICWWYPIDLLLGIWFYLFRVSSLPQVVP